MTIFLCVMGGWILNIKYSVLSGESADVCQGDVDDWKLRLKDICQGYELKDIFNTDESGLLFRMIMTRSLVEKGDSCKGGKLSKERITFIPCTSALGEKLKLLVIGKSKNPRCFKGYTKDNLGVFYESNQKAWMTNAIFEPWLKKLNNKMALQHRKILLLMDNCSSHSAPKLSNVKIVFFPPNTTSKLQPMDAGIIQTVKLLYRKKLLGHLIFKMEDATNATEIF